MRKYKSTIKSSETCSVFLLKTFNLALNTESFRFRNVNLLCVQCFYAIQGVAQHFATPCIFFNFCLPSRWHISTKNNLLCLQCFYNAIQGFAQYFATSCIFFNFYLPSRWHISTKNNLLCVQCFYNDIQGVAQYFATPCIFFYFCLPSLWHISTKNNLSKTTPWLILLVKGVMLKTIYIFVSCWIF